MQSTHFSADKDAIESNQPKPAADQDTLSEQAVASYLQNHPDFFRIYPELLAHMSLPHQSGNAVSLVERQVAILRERSIQTRQKLGQLIEAAKDNDVLLQKTQQLVLQLLDAESLESTFDVLKQSLKNDFDVQTVSLLVFTEEGISDNLKIDTLYTASTSQLDESAKDLMTLEGSTCGILRPEEVSCLFPHENKSDIGSTAITFRTLSNQAVLMLGIAHPDVEHYSGNTGTLFLDYLTDVLCKISNRHLA